MNQTMDVIERDRDESFTQLHEACAKGTLDEQLLEKYAADIHALTGARQSTPLHIAAEYGHEHVVALLLEHSDAVSDIKTKDYEGDTPIHIAAVTGNKFILKRLLQKLKEPFEIDLLNGKHQTPLHYAAGKGNLEAVEFLLENGANKEAHDLATGATPFHFAARCGNTAVMEKLICAVDDETIEVNGRDLGLTALHFAAWNGQKNDAVKWLLGKGACVSKADRNGDTALHWAARNGCSDIIDCLIMANANACAVNNKGELAVGLACDYGKGRPVVTAIFTALKKLLEPLPKSSIRRLFDPLASHKNKATLLHYVAAYGNIENLEWIVDQIRNVSRRNKKGKDDNFECNMNMKDEEGMCALHWAAREGNSIQIPGKNKAELVRALVEGSMNFIQILGKNKVDLLSRDKNGRTALCLALIEQKLEFAEGLVKCLGEKMNPEQWQYDIDTWTLAINKEIDEKEVEEFENGTIEHHGKEKLMTEMPLLYKALQTGKKKVAKLIVRYTNGDGVKDVVNRKGMITGRTALHWATILQKKGIVMMLCRTKIFAKALTATVTDNYGKSPLDYARDSDIIKELLKRPDVQSQVDGLYRDRQVLVDAANAILIGAALIATVAFSGWLIPSLNETFEYFPRHLSLRLFWAFNSLSFFFSIAAVLAGAYAVLPVPEKDIPNVVRKIRRALMCAALLLAIAITFVLASFSTAGFVMLPSCRKAKSNMIVTISIGAPVCLLCIIVFLSRLYKLQLEGLGFCNSMSENASGHADGTDASDQPRTSVGLTQEYRKGARYEDLPWDDGFDRNE